MCPRYDEEKPSIMYPSSTHSTLSKWFLIGFVVRATLAVVVTLMMLRNFESVMLYFADLPTMLFLALAEETLPSSLFKILAGNHPFYIFMNLIACLLWGGIFMLIPLARNTVFLLGRKIAKT